MLIGLTGKKQSGKDTAANFLVEKGWVKIGFADPMRWRMEKLNPIVSACMMRDGAPDSDFKLRESLIRWNDAVERFGYDKAKEVYPEMRRLLQIDGTEAGRDLFGPYLGNPWLQIASIRIQQALLEGKNVVISDVRFDDEAELIHKLGGKVLQVFRDATYQSNDQHVSEQGVNDHLLDHTIINNDSPGHLRQYVLRLVAGLEREAMGQTEYDPKDVAFVKAEINEEQPSAIERASRNIAANTFESENGVFDIGTVLQIGEIIFAIIERCRQSTPDDVLTAKISKPGLLERLVVRRECVKSLGRARFRQYGGELVDAILQEGQSAAAYEIKELLTEIP